MKIILPFLLLAAAFAMAGCEMSATDEHSKLTVEDGTVSSFTTQQGNIVITAHSNANTVLVN